MFYIAHSVLQLGGSAHDSGSQIGARLSVLAGAKPSHYLLPRRTFHCSHAGVQVVHHLFPNVCHTHYPAIAPIVVDTCREFGIPYKIYPSVRTPLGPHCLHNFIRLYGLCAWGKHRLHASKDIPVPAA